jgi:multidrug efflux system membrane fusion protein
MPMEALQAGPNGSFVYVAKPDQTVEVRRVKTLPATKDRLIVESGLAMGEKVVTDGQLRLVPGGKYEARGDAKGDGKGGPPKGPPMAKADGAPGKAEAKGDAPGKAEAAPGK